MLESGVQQSAAKLKNGSSGLDLLQHPRRGYYTLLAWLPSYFELSLGLNVESSSLLTLIPYLAMTAMTPFVGPIADGLVSGGWTITNVRKLAQVGSACKGAAERVFWVDASLTASLQPIA